ncbi:MAG: right-handed parallel beta-helix repeat-containing protein [Verrucomicrobiales bacterium]
MHASSRRDATAYLLCSVLTLFMVARMGAESVTVQPGDDFQALIDANPPGTTFIVSPGIYRGVSIYPKTGSIIEGQPGAILSGAQRVTAWRHEPPYWVSDQPLPAVEPEFYDAYFCRVPTCAFPQDLYRDGDFVDRVLDLSMLSTTTQWFMDQATRRAYVRFDPSAHEMEISGPKLGAVLAALTEPGYGHNITLRGLIIERYPSPPLNGTVGGGDGWLIENCEVRYNHAYGIVINSGGTVRGCYAHHNGQVGIGGSGINIVVEHNEMAFNTRLEFFNAWGSGGAKFAFCHGLRFRDNYSHGNSGPGIWLDIDSSDSIFERNIVEDNDWEGLLLEISCGGEARNNVCRRNGLVSRHHLWGAQICLQNAKEFVVHHNFLEAPFSPWPAVSNGLIMINQQRDTGPCGARVLDHNSASDNLVILAYPGNNGVSYGTYGWSTFEDFVASEIYWARNRYVVGYPLNATFNYWTPETLPTIIHSEPMGWERWQELRQDVEGTYETRSLEFFNPNGPFVEPLIAPVVGFDYAMAKASFAREPTDPALDTDSDSLPDWWERKHRLDWHTGDSVADSDSDGLSNANEFALLTDPRKVDTDDDGVPDRWEVEHSLLPRKADGHLDPDNDGRPNFEEYEEDTDPFSAEPLNVRIPEEALSVWLRAGMGAEADGMGQVVTWADHSRHRRIIFPGGATLVDGRFPVPGRKLISPGPFGTVARASSDFFSNGRDEGFTVFLVVEPGLVDRTKDWRSVATNESYGENGFRLLTQSGYFRWQSLQDLGTLDLYGPSRMVEGTPTILCCSYGGRSGAGASRIYRDGRQERSGTGRIKIAPAGLALGYTGGLVQQPIGFAEVIVFNRQLTHRQRRTVERLLNEYYFSPAPPRDDTDFDGLSNLAELTARTNPLIPDALDDPDKDGYTNEEEVKNGTDPHAVDLGADGDKDLVTDAEELEDDTDPRVPNAFFTSLPFHKLSLWLKADLGTEVGTEGAINRWDDQSGQLRHAVTEGAPGLAATAWLENGPAAVSLLTGQLHASRGAADVLDSERGFEMLAVWRLKGTPTGPAIAYSSGLPEDGFSIGFQSNALVVRNATAEFAGPSVVENQRLLLGFRHERPAARARIYVDGILRAGYPATSLSAGTGGLWLGARPGQNPANIDLAELLFFREPLSNRERKLVESYLTAKWLASGPALVDHDQDGLPTWWELQFAGAPFVPDGSGDLDLDGVTNVAEFQQRTAGFEFVDADGDGMPDAWEVAWGLDAAIDDAQLDPDGDGIINFIEFTLGSDPKAMASVDIGRIAVAREGAAFAFSVNRQAWQSSVRIQWSSDLAPPSWQDGGSGAPDIEQLDPFRDRLTFQIPGSVPRGFFRLKIGRQP